MPYFATTQIRHMITIVWHLIRIKIIVKPTGSLYLHIIFFHFLPFLVGCKWLVHDSPITFRDKWSHCHSPAHGYNCQDPGVKQTLVLRLAFNFKTFLNKTVLIWNMKFGDLSTMQGPILHYFWRGWTNSPYYVEFNLFYNLFWSGTV